MNLLRHPALVSRWAVRCGCVLGALLALATAHAAAPRPAASKPPLRAGAAAVDITPQQFPLNMPGGFNANMAQSAHDPLHARALVLADDATTLALVVVDTLSMGRETADEAKALAAKRTGMKPEKMLLCATHTHSGPGSSARSGNAQSEAYHKRLVEGIAEAITRAHKALRPAAVGAAAYPLPDEVSNRRWFLKPGKMPLNPFGKLDQVKMNPPHGPDVLDRPAGPTDPDVTVLSVQDAKSHKPLCLFASYSLHYVGGTPKGMVSADYFGEFARLMPARVHGDAEFVAMLANGTSGDINNISFLKARPPRAPFEQIRIVAGKTAAAATQALQSIGTHQPDARLGMIQREVTLRTRRPTAEQVAAAKAVLAIKDKAAQEKLPRLATNYAGSTLALAQGAETVRVLLQTVQIGDLAICALPFETFCEIGLTLKRESPFPRTVVIGIANGSHGYLPTPEQHKLGGYETWPGTNRVQADASVILTKHLREMLAELKR